MSAGFNGKYTEIQAELDACDKMMENMKLMYLRETKIPKKLLKQIMKKDIYLDAFDCIKYNIVDEIL
jgi:ATP-dependent protease ClpP protease subunit